MGGSNSGSGGLTVTPSTAPARAAKSSMSIVTYPSIGTP